MPLQPLLFAPGVSKVNSPYADQSQVSYTAGRMLRGRFSDGSNTRFVAGFPEKVGGWVAAPSSGGAAIVGVPRGMLNWVDLSQILRTAFGTNQKLFIYSSGLYTDITPWRSVVTGSLTNALSTTNGSATVTVAHTAHGLSTNDYVQLTASATIGGLTIAGVYFVTVVNANSYTITASSQANATVSGGGGTLSYTYYRITLGANPIATTIGSSTVTITATAHGASPGDYVTISGATAVGGLTISGEYQIQTTTTNTYTIIASSAATSTATGGGSSVTAEYDISTGLLNSAVGQGYGVGGYGVGGYGSASATSIILNARTWSLAPYGQQLLACPFGGGIYVWDPANTVQTRAYPLYNAPTQNNSIFVTPESFIVALGSNGNPRYVSWPDQSNYNNWTPSLTNTAELNRPVQSGSELLAGLPVRNGLSMFWTNTDAFTMTYTGDSNVYAFELAGEQAGLAGPLAATSLGGITYWMSPFDFWMWNGGASRMPSDDIRDYVFKNINLTQLAKCAAFTIKAKNEVGFFYCSAQSSEIDSAVVFQIDQQAWWIGSVKFARTSWVDAGLAAYPMAFDSSGILYNHENGTDANGSALDAYITYAPIELSNGDRSMDIFGFWPDFERISGNVTLTVLTQNYPMDAVTNIGPTTIAPDGSTPRIDLRTNSRLAGWKLESNVVGGDFRLAQMRAEVQPAGARR